MADGQDFHEQLGALGDCAASHLGEDLAQTFQIEDTAASNGQVDSQNSAGGICGKPPGSQRPGRDW